MRISWTKLIVGVSLASACASSTQGAEVSDTGLSPLVRLGKQLFFDTNLSNPAGQSCASCHSPEAGFTSPDSGINALGAVHPGARAQFFGNRKPPTVAYAAFSPAFGYNSEDETYVGGQFWDGRAADLAAQATGPLLNPVEQNNAGAADLLQKLGAARYRGLFEQINGPDTLNSDPANEARLLDRIAAALAAYESSSEVNPFNSKYDAYLAGRAGLSAQEARGLALFEGRGNCAACHPNRPGDGGQPPLLTDFTYDNLGLPRNPRSPFYRMPADVNPDGIKYVDLGVGAITKNPEHYGKFKVPTLRNVDRRPHARFIKAYGHNGYFKTLKQVVHFYNERDVSPDEFPAPEYPETVNREELGALGLSEAEEDDLVAFLRTLSDGYEAPATADRDNQEPGSSAVTPVVATDDIANFESAQRVIRVLRYVEHQHRVAEERPPAQRRR